MMKVLTTFVLVGTVDSTDQYFASVEINTNPPVAEHSIAVMPLSAFPCEVTEGDLFYILKLTPDSIPVIICEDDGENKSNVGE